MITLVIGRIQKFWTSLSSLVTATVLLFVTLLSPRQFQCEGQSLLDALRQFLAAFRLPGESPVISRILESFSSHWLVSDVVLSCIDSDLFIW